MAQIFLSYSRKDGNDYVAEVQRELETRGYATWRDIRNLHPDQDFTADIEAGIAESSHVVVCVTQDTKRDNSFVRREIQYALAIKKPVIPLRCHDTVPHISIINNEWVDYFRDKGLAVERLTEILNDARLQNEPGDQPADPFRPYLEAALQSIVTGLQQRIIRQIDLRSKATPDAVNAPERKAQAKSVDIFQLAMSGVKMGGDKEPEKVEAKTDFETFAEAFEYYNHRVLLMGEPGAGKTITLMAYAREAYAARLEDPTKPLPLFGLIPTWNPETQPPLADWLAETYRLDKVAVQREVEQGRALLLLDGLDELGREREIKDEDGKIIKRYDPRLRFIKVLPSNSQILMTSRIEDYNDLATRGRKAVLDGAVTLQPLGDVQMAEYLSEQSELWQLIQEDEQLKEITTTPLLMSFFAFAYQDMSMDERGQLTLLQSAFDLRDRIFLGYIEKRYEHERTKVNSDLSFSLKEMMYLLGKLAMWNVGARKMTSESSLTYDQGVRITNQFSALSVLVTRLHIMIPAGKDAFRFIHLLLRDVLAYVFSVSQLESSDRVSKRLAVSALRKVGDKRITELLIATLQDNDTVIRRRSASALGYIGDSRAVDPLITALQDRDFSVRQYALSALGQLRDTRAIKPLVIALRDEREDIRNIAALALGQIGDLGIEALLIEFKDADENVRKCISSAFIKLKDLRAIEPLMAALNDTNIFIRRRAAEALGQIGDDRAVIPLIKALKDADAGVSRRAAEALGHVPDNRAVESLIEILIHGDQVIRSRAAWALGRIEDKRAVEHLIRALNDEYEAVRHRAAFALGQIKDDRAVKPLIVLLDDKSKYVHFRAASALEKIGTLEALAAVEEWRKQNPNG